MAQVDLLILPYASANGRSLLHVLLEQFEDPSWTDFSIAVAFLNCTGNYQQLIDAMVRFADRGSTVALTFGADSFADEMGSDYVALCDLLEAFRGKPTVQIHLYHEPGRIFHPKIYLFSSPERALLILGSSNWSAGGLMDNVEANVVLRLDLQVEEDKRTYDILQEHFLRYWRQNP